MIYNSLQRLPLSVGVGSGASGLVFGASVVSSPLPESWTTIHFVTRIRRLDIFRNIIFFNDSIDGIISHDYLHPISLSELILNIAVCSSVILRISPLL